MLKEYPDLQSPTATKENALPILQEINEILQQNATEPGSRKCLELLYDKFLFSRDLELAIDELRAEINDLWMEYNLIYSNFYNKPNQTIESVRLSKIKAHIEYISTLIASLSIVLEAGNQGKDIGTMCAEIEQIPDLPGQKQRLSKIREILKTHEAIGIVDMIFARRLVAQKGSNIFGNDLDSWHPQYEEMQKLQSVRSDLRTVRDELVEAEKNVSRDSVLHEKKQQQEVEILYAKIYEGIEQANLKLRAYLEKKYCLDTEKASIQNYDTWIQADEELHSKLLAEVKGMYLLFEQLGLKNACFFGTDRMNAIGVGLSVGAIKRNIKDNDFIESLKFWKNIKINKYLKQLIHLQERLENVETHLNLAKYKRNYFVKIDPELQEEVEKIRKEFLKNMDLVNFWLGNYVRIKGRPFSEIVSIDFRRQNLDELFEAFRSMREQPNATK